jgi:ribonuclease HI
MTELEKLNDVYSNIQAALDELSVEWKKSASRRPKNQRAECLLENALSLIDEIRDVPPIIEEARSQRMRRF